MKSIKNKIMVSLLPLIFMSGCSDKKEEKKETFKTVKYYDMNPKVREKRIKECDSLEEMTKAIIMDCKNAKVSYSKTQSTRYSPSDF